MGWIVASRTLGCVRGYKENLEISQDSLQSVCWRYPAVETPVVPQGRKYRHQVQANLIWKTSGEQDNNCRPGRYTRNRLDAGSARPSS